MYQLYYYSRLSRWKEYLMRKGISYEHKIFYYKYNEDLGGWIKEDRLYTIDAKEVKKKLNKPEHKKIGRSRKVYLLHDLL